MVAHDSDDSYVVDEKPRYTPQSEPKTEAQGGETLGETSKFPSEQWSKYLEETGDRDKEMVERYIKEADTTLVFSGLFSAIVTVSIVESYKWLSPNPGDQTVKLLAQLVNISSGIPFETISAGSSQPFKPSTSALMVNVTWFCSVVLCLGCSVFATVIQQQARRYLVLTQRPGAPYERARLRMFLFDGLGKFQVDCLHQLLAMSLHTSILLYCVGLVIYIFTIGEGIGFLTLGPITLGPLALGYLAIFYLSVFYLIYAISTVLPFFYFDCPYGTPFTSIAWWSYHIFWTGVFSTIRCIPGLGLEKRINEHKQRFRDGLQRTVELYGIQAQQSVDTNALEWTLRAPIEKNKTENTATLVPEFFDYYALSEFHPTKPISFSRIKTYILRFFASKSVPVKRENPKRLRISLKCLWSWVRVYNQNSVPLPSHFEFPPKPSPESPAVTERLLEDWARQDPVAGTIGRCFGALVAKKLATDINSSHDSGVGVQDAKLKLSAILGTKIPVETLLGHPGAISLASITFLKPRKDTERAPSDVLDIFRTTVRILAEDIPTSPDVGLPPWKDLVTDFKMTYSGAQGLAQKVPALSRLVDQLEPIQGSEESAVSSEALQAGDGQLCTAWACV